MLTKILTISFLLSFSCVNSQTVSHVYKIDGLIKRISQPDTIYVVNFWATWCKPCVRELPVFDSLYANTKSTNIKVLLVCLDFVEEMEKKVKPFLIKNNVRSECVILDEVNGNNFINKILDKWTGAIPATYFKHGEKSEFLERKVDLKDLEEWVKKVQ